LSIPRPKAEKLATDLGAKISGVSKKLTYLVTNDTESGSSKNRKALELGIKVINEQEFFKLVNYRDAVPEQNSNQFDISSL
jgi:DNA ligase (NAD+)